MTWQEALKTGTARLKACGIEEAGQDAWILLEEYGQIKERIKKNQGVLQVSGCIDSQKSHFIYCIVS